MMVWFSDALSSHMTILEPCRFITKMTGILDFTLSILTQPIRLYPQKYP
jgi:hypothetical protein